MADDFWTRKRKQEEKEEEERREEVERAKKRARLNGMGGGGTMEISADVLKKFEELMQRVPIMLNQMDNLYRQYIRGVMRRPPIEERQRLEQTMNFLMNMPKPNATERFAFGSAWSSYTTHRRRWERWLQEMEAGKVKHASKEAKEELKKKEIKGKKGSDPV